MNGVTVTFIDFETGLPIVVPEPLKLLALPSKGDAFTIVDDRKQPDGDSEYRYYRVADVSHSLLVESAFAMSHVVRIMLRETEV